MTEQTTTESPESGCVVVGIDDSAEARRALACAADIARRRHWTLRIVHVWQMSYPVAPYAIEPTNVGELLEQAAEATLREVETDVLGGQPSLEVERVLAQGPPAAVLVEASKDADLLVVGSRGRGGFASLALGSVSSACVHHALCPVLVMRARRAPRDNP